eukprot:gene7647-8949_t
MLSLVAVIESTNYCQVLGLALLFYKANRSGKIPDNDVPWRTADSCMKDGQDVKTDLSGGYFDAGDHVKFALPMAFSMTMLSWAFIEFQDKIEQCKLTKMFQDDIKFGTDWLMAAHISPYQFVGQVGQGGPDHAFWGPSQDLPSSMYRPSYVLSQDRSGTEVLMEASAALSAASIVFAKSDPDYAESCIEHAKQLHLFGDKYRKVYHESIPDATEFYKSSGYNDEIVWGTVWLYKATNDQAMKDKAVTDYNSFNLKYQQSGQALSWDQKAPGVAMLMSQIFGGSYKDDVESYLNYWQPSGGIKYTPGGLAWYQEWGPTRYSANTAFIAGIAGGQKYLDFGKKQIGYMLGDNPKSQSFVVGYGPKAPKNPHHRNAHNSLVHKITSPVDNEFIIYGALVGGPSLDDVYVDNREDYKKNEIATDYNAGFVGALASLINEDSFPVAIGDGGTNDPFDPHQKFASAPKTNIINMYLYLLIATIIAAILYM